MRSERLVSRACALALSFSVLTATMAMAATPAHADDGDPAVLFRKGVDAYQHGQTADAIRYWEALYTQVGPKRGYRVAFNLARAYAVFGDTTQSAQDYEAFLAEVATERQENATIDPTVTKEEGEARVELEALKAKNGRLHLLAATQPVAASVDGAAARVSGFTVYVTPGEHRVVFAPATAMESTRVVTVPAGQVLDIEPPPPPAAPVEVPKTAPAPSPPPLATHIERPFSPIVLYVAGGAAVVSSLVPILTYEHASTLQSRALKDRTGSDYATRVSDYDSARSTAYATLAVPLGLAAISVGLGAWYLLGTRHVESAAAAARRPRVLPFVTPLTPLAGEGRGGTVGLTGTF